jgi:tetratricopeptide (TPR) repeat protein
MSQSDPRSRSISLFAVANQGLFLVIVGFVIFKLTQSALAGIGAAVLLIVWLRWIRSILLKPFRQGIRLIGEEKFTEAATAFERGHHFFEQFAVLDMFRAILLLSPSRMGYRELALTNLGYAYLRAGEREKAKSTYERLQSEYPHSRAANVALRQLAGDAKPQSSEPAVSEPIATDPPSTNPTSNDEMTS